MKNIIAIFVLVISPLAWASSGPEVPIPIISFTDAYDLAKKELLYSRHNIDPIHAPASGYILGRISYDKKAGSWVWVVEFFHPKANDHSVTYHITQNGSVIFNGATE